MTMEISVHFHGKPPVLDESWRSNYAPSWLVLAPSILSLERRGFVNKKLGAADVAKNMAFWEYM